MAHSTSAPIHSPHSRFLLPAAVLALAACGASSAPSPASAPPKEQRYPRPAAAVHVFTTPPPRPYLELETLQSSYRPRHSPAERDRYLARLVEEAGRKGCDGLILNQQGPLAGTAAPGAGYRPYDERPLTGLWGTCIAFVDEEEGR